MSIESVQEFLSEHGRGGAIRRTDGSSATVAEAAAAFGVEPARIAKTLSFRGDSPETCILVVMAGDARTDNAAFKARFGRKATMLKADEVEALTGHPVGGVCPFANPESATVFLDTSLKRFDTVFPAVGSADSAIELTPAELEVLSGASAWVTVSRLA
ncbi:YbaK/EbsC family protein [Aeromicrobium tamlense]|uniref:Prolyl-tRNA editing enzyme YbaK/EbsC (Cys-tRNA(Pro) deacylase) n=1 Tax=Aeromicrobium tamlense TaxID=375541 RepID=A0A8I0FVR1_9ACTN|nr:YbaK/EbsC family protein [Aeromicrobium tamlense]MBD1270339.1 YbaK/EbsC family protein [Aeromicrobium tamlense]MBD1271529.1 YbaK/EbsC family protein [Aeromicrobium tamlense]NYI37725.1 prolyl-tRNA editing enzyme YbaK/EbsC (Cys-tRNA(Pro) deacylase) [Aeromicrobium tamlense]